MRFVLPTLFIILLASCQPSSQYRGKILEDKQGRVSFELLTLDYPLKENCAGAPRVDGPLETLCLLYSRLASADIASASGMSENEPKAREKYQQYMERTGRDEFMNSFRRMLDGSLHVTGIAHLGEYFMILTSLANKERSLAFRIFRKNSSGTYVEVDEENDTFMQLVRVYYVLRDGSGKISDG